MATVTARQRVTATDSATFTFDAGDLEQFRGALCSGSKIPGSTPATARLIATNMIAARPMPIFKMAGFGGVDGYGDGRLLNLARQTIDQQRDIGAQRHRSSYQQRIRHSHAPIINLRQLQFHQRQNTASIAGDRAGRSTGTAASTPTGVRPSVDLWRDAECNQQAGGGPRSWRARDSAAMRAVCQLQPDRLQRQACAVFVMNEVSGTDRRPSPTFGDRQRGRGINVAAVGPPRCRSSKTTSVLPAAVRASYRRLPAAAWPPVARSSPISSMHRRRPTLIAPTSPVPPPIPRPGPIRNG